MFEITDSRCAQIKDRYIVEYGLKPLPESLPKGHRRTELLKKYTESVRNYYNPDDNYGSEGDDEINVNYKLTGKHFNFIIS